MMMDAAPYVDGPGRAFFLPPHRGGGGVDAQPRTSSTPSQPAGLPVEPTAVHVPYSTTPYDKGLPNDGEAARLTPPRPLSSSLSGQRPRAGCGPPPRSARSPARFAAAPPAAASPRAPGRPPKTPPSAPSSAGRAPATGRLSPPHCGVGQASSAGSGGSTTSTRRLSRLPGRPPRMRCWFRGTAGWETRGQRYPLTFRAAPTIASRTGGTRLSAEGEKRLRRGRRQRGCRPSPRPRVPGWT